MEVKMFANSKKKLLIKLNENIKQILDCEQF